MNSIASFRGRYHFLSNFYPAAVTYEGIYYPTTEHAFQAAKTLDRERRFVIANASSPGAAKYFGRQCALRPDWDEIRVDIMLDILRLKFADPDLRALLLATGDADLVEGNTWGDRFWGVCNGQGENWLGQCLMAVRSELR